MNNLIGYSLLINYLNLTANTESKKVNTEAAAHQFSISVKSS